MALWFYGCFYVARGRKLPRAFLYSPLEVSLGLWCVLANGLRLLQEFCSGFLPRCAVGAHHGG